MKLGRVVVPPLSLEIVFMPVPVPPVPRVLRLPVSPAPCSSLAQGSVQVKVALAQNWPPNFARPNINSKPRSGRPAFSTLRQSYNPAVQHRHQRIFSLLDILSPSIHHSTFATMASATSFYDFKVPNSKSNHLIPLRPPC